ncbi:sodium-translocating pyrophosphatase [Candidatus Woesearchaeota archaeon]|nr:sodium-translocating pyrophosphatase [Candidatus Woesearchaeota archaeon]
MGYVLLSSFIALGFAFYISRNILKEPEGSQEMIDYSSAVREGAKAYLTRQYKVIAIYFAVVFVILALMAYYDYVVIFTPLAFLTGGFFSGLSGFIGMQIATRANVRTTNAARKSLNKGLRIAFSSGTVMGMVVVGLVLLHISIWYIVLNWYYGNFEVAERMVFITASLLTLEMGASSIALFARVGGGIFTKAADIGADLVGKIEHNVPEDDPRNPAVIADNVGDNVGDVAGMGADLYESYAGSLIATLALAIAAGLGIDGTVVPLGIAGAGVLASIVGVYLVRTGDRLSQAALLRALRKGVYGSAALVAVASYFIVRYALGAEHIGIFYCILVGLATGMVIGASTEYFTSHHYRPAKRVAEASRTGPATVVLSGISVGMLSTAVPVVTIGTAIMLSFIFSGGMANPQLGLYGIGVAAVGMLSTLGITLATDAYGPVADNAGGIAEATSQPPIVRKRTDAFDAIGNTTAATGKGFAIGSAALTTLALIAAYKEELSVVAAKFGRELVMDLSLMNPKIMVGLIIGGGIPFVFCALTNNSVAKAAHSIVMEVRRQFKSKLILKGKKKPDYERCVRIATKSAQKQMILPSLLAIVMPLAVGFLLGVEAVIGLLTGALVSGFALAVFMANAGGVWDNAKKWIEAGNLGGKGSDSHKASVVGDTIGDPFKDTSGPSLNILIKLMSMVSLVFAGFILLNSLV